MKIFTLTSIAGTDVSCPPGAVVDWPNEAEAKRMIAGGNARNPTEAELAVAVERKNAADAVAKARTEELVKTAEIISAADKKRAADAKKADAKKRKAAGSVAGAPPKLKAKK
jgi:hypothetical protein